MKFKTTKFNSEDLFQLFSRKVLTTRITCYTVIAVCVHLHVLCFIHILILLISALPGRRFS